MKDNRLPYTALAHQRQSLASYLVPIVLTAVFVAIALAVQNGLTEPVDGTIMMIFRDAADASYPTGPAWFQELAHDVTALGSVTILAFLTVLVLGYMFVAGRTQSMLWITVSIVGAEALNVGLKHAFNRPRPDIQHAARVFTSSFPSGHALMSSAVFLTLALVASTSGPRQGVSAYCVISAVLLAGLVGLSRIYLGLHYPSDVAAGWCVGFAWAMLCRSAFAPRTR